MASLALTQKKSAKWRSSGRRGTVDGTGSRRPVGGAAGSRGALRPRWGSCGASGFWWTCALDPRRAPQSETSPSRWSTTSYPVSVASPSLATGLRYARLREVLSRSQRHAARRTEHLTTPLGARRANHETFWLRRQSEGSKAGRGDLRLDEDHRRLGRTRFRGLARTQLAAYFVGAAYNLLRMAKLLAA